MKELFVEGYNNSLDKDTIYLSNGFSTVYNLCENLIQIPVNANKKYVMDKWDPTIPKNILVESIKRYNTDKVYVSCIFEMEPVYVYLASLELPDVDFIVGGPAAYLFHAFVNPLLLPQRKNFKIVIDNLRSIFKNYDEREWGLKIPNNISNSDILFSVSFNKPCFWGKCIFCSSPIFLGDTVYTYSNIPNIDNKLTAYYTSPDMLPEDIKLLLPIINEKSNIYHTFYWRASGNKITELKSFFHEIKTPQRLCFRIGGEFLSDRMLMYMKKGITLEEYLKTLKYLLDSGCNVYLSIILGWDNLIDDDIRSFDKFIDKIKDYNNIEFSLRWLTLTNSSFKKFDKDKNYMETNTEVRQFENSMNIPRVWKDMIYYMLLLNKEQFLLNYEMYNIINTKIRNISGSNEILRILNGISENLKLRI